MEKFSRPPPEKRLSSCRKPLPPMTPSRAWRSMPGTGTLASIRTMTSMPRMKRILRRISGARKALTSASNTAYSVALPLSASTSGSRRLVGGLRDRVHGRFGRRVVSLDGVRRGLRRSVSRHVSAGRCGHGRQQLDEAASLLDLGASRGREGVGSHEELDLGVAQAEHLERAVGVPDEAGSGEHLGVHGERLLAAGLATEAAGRRVLRDAPDVDDLVLDAVAPLEAAQLGDAHVDGCLAALEPGRDAGPGA